MQIDGTGNVCCTQRQLKYANGPNCFITNLAPALGANAFFSLVEAQISTTCIVLVCVYLSLRSVVEVKTILHTLERFGVSSLVPAAKITPDNLNLLQKKH